MLLPRDVLEYILPLYFIFASQIRQSNVPLFIDLSQSGCVSSKSKNFNMGELCEHAETKGLFLIPFLFIIILLPHLWSLFFGAL
jgi:hypothetical protein